MLLELCALPDYDGSDKSELKNKCREHAGYRCVNVMKVLIDVGAGIAGLIAILKSANGWSGPGLVTFFVAWRQLSTSVREPQPWSCAPPVWHQRTPCESTTLHACDALMQCTACMHDVTARNYDSFTEAVVALVIPTLSRCKR
eukprot:5678-Heterococcus_DN1.PRE.1